jgi:hypothetical protein
LVICYTAHTYAGTAGLPLPGFMTSRNIYPRMPVILLKEDEKEWLNLDIIEPE